MRERSKKCRNEVERVKRRMEGRKQRTKKKRRMLHYELLVRVSSRNEVFLHFIKMLIEWYNA